MSDPARDPTALLELFASYRQTIQGLLQATPAAVDLAVAAPNLLWLFAAYVEQGDVPVRVACRVLERKRLHVLRWCIGSGATGTTLRLLLRVRGLRRSDAELELLDRVLRSPDIVHWLRHAPDVTVEDLARVLGAQWCLPFPFFRAVLREARARPAALEAATAFALDVEVLGEKVGRNDATDRLERCRSVAHLRRLRDRWAAEALRRARLPDSRVLVRRYGTTRFDPAPIPGTRVIHPIETLDALVKEGLEMSHCVGDMGACAFAGWTYFYRVLEPERATLQLVAEQRRFAIHELAGPGSAPVGPETWLAVRSWLAAATRR
ncbi:MAG: hypothetical protein KC776_19050 [Myxococcales bacterium]|nr:hypothetical protein [Myxococcales bacterium]MCB9576657.1 hypothetical protein [Polyangiaceae bacterium]